MQGLMVSWWRRACSATLVLVATALSIAACGGGGGVGEGGTGTFVSGPVTGLGTVTVGGVRFDDDSATFEDEDDASGSGRDRLRLGMYITVEGGSVSVVGGENTATATRVRFGRAVVGPVTFDGVGADSLRVLGLRVRLTQATVRGAGLEGDLSGRGDLVSRIVAVHGFFADGLLPVFVATRIDLLEQTPLQFKVIGVARDVNATAKTLRIGGQLFDLAGVTANVQDGDVVRLRVDTAKVADRWVVRQIAVGSGLTLPDANEAKLEGAVTSLSSSPSLSFSVNGIAVITDATTQFPDGTPALGDRVKVEGSVSGGALRAREVEIRSDEEVDEEELKVHGSVTSLDTVARTFVVRTQVGGREVPVSYDDTTQFDEGSAANLSDPNATVEVRGTWSAVTGRLQAIEIEFE